MKNIYARLTQQFYERLADPNWSLGGAITYMLRHWEKLTLFRRKPGAAPDNNTCERAMKRAILHRKNAVYYYMTENGANVGYVLLSVIHTCQLCYTFCTLAGRVPAT